MDRPPPFIVTFFWANLNILLRHGSPSFLQSHFVRIQYLAKIRIMLLCLDTIWIPPTPNHVFYRLAKTIGENILPLIIHNIGSVCDIKSGLSSS